MAEETWAWEENNPDKTNTLLDLFVLGHTENFTNSIINYHHVINRSGVSIKVRGAGDWHTFIGNFYFLYLTPVMGHICGEWSLI